MSKSALSKLLLIFLMCSHHRVSSLQHVKDESQDNQFRHNSVLDGTKDLLGRLLVARSRSPIPEFPESGLRSQLSKASQGEETIDSEKDEKKQWSKDEMSFIRMLIHDGIWRNSFESKWFVPDTQKLGTSDSPINPEVIKMVMKYLSEFYLPDPDIISNPECSADLKILYNQQFSSTSDIVKFIDSWGKIPDGFLAGNTEVFGSFHECTKIDVQRGENETGIFQGQYCHVTYKKDDDTNENKLHLRSPFILDVIPSLLSMYSYGTCMPSSCTVEDLWVSLSQKLQQFDLDVGYIVCQTKEPPAFDFSANGIVMVIILAIGGALIFIGGVVDIWIRFTGKIYLKKSNLKYLLIFSFYTNLEKMFLINTSHNTEAITCIYGIRVLSMTWVVLGHQYMLTALTSPNKLEILDLLKNNFLLQVVTNAFPSVDTFFLMSGLLVTYGLFKEQQRTGKFNFALYYFHRIIRLVPPIGLLAGFMGTFPKILVNGPLAPLVDAETSLSGKCRKYWWRDVTFISNYYVDGKQESCLGVCWYTSVDFQLYCLAPLMVLPFLLKRSWSTKVGLVWLTFLTLLSVVIPAIIIGVNQLPPDVVLGGSTGSKNVNEYAKLVYNMPWCRASPYIVGLFLGYILRKNDKEKICLKPWQIVVGWVFAFGMGIAVVFGTYNYNQVGTSHDYNWASSIFYGSLHSLLWGQAVAWVIFACHNGYGGPINSFLSHHSWQPLSRLTYCMFLIAIPLQEIIFIYSVHIPAYYSHLNKVIETVGVLFIAGLGGIVLSLYAEAPVLGLERLLLRKER